MTEKPDLTKAKDGDIAHLRCGGSFVLDHAPEKLDENSCLVNNCAGYFNDGKFAGSETPFDIIRIEPAAFDWNSVKRGMAFRLNGRNGEDDIYFYIGEHLHDDGRAVFECNEGNFAYDGFSKKNVTRAPEHDMEVVK